LVIVALVFAFVFKGHDEAVLVCAAVGIILALAAIIWCAVELVWCISYQGPIFGNFGQPPSELGSQGSLRTSGIDYFLKLVTDPSNKANKKATIMETTHKYGHICKGRCYDWSYRKEILTMRMDCRRKVEKWYLGKFLDKMKYCNTEAYDGVDTYSASPIYQSHQDIVDGNKVQYAKKSLSYTARKEALKEICDNFNVKKFIDKRKKCDNKLKKKLKPKCFEKFGGYFFEEGKKEKDLEKDDCKLKIDGEKMYIYEQSKYCELTDKYDRFMKGTPKPRKELNADHDLSKQNPMKGCELQDIIGTG